MITGKKPGPVPTEQYRLPNLHRIVWQLFGSPSGPIALSHTIACSLGIVLVFICAALLSCGGGSSFPTSGGSSGHAGHVFLIVEENHSYSEVVGNPQMPYLNSLIGQGGLGTQYFADTHPSIGNYFELTTGQIITNNDSFSGTVSVPDIVTALDAARQTWKSYAESLPSVGYTGGDVFPYLRRHNPFTYFTEVRSSSNNLLNLQAFSQFSIDLNHGQLAKFSYIVPNALHDAHNGTLQQADQWLQANIAPLLGSQTFQKDGLLVITFDESASVDLAMGGGHVVWVVIGPQAKKGYQSTSVYQHQSTLRLILKSLGATTLPGAANSAPDMTEFLQ